MDNFVDVGKLRECFIKRMTVDSETKDRRRKDYNRAIFFLSRDNEEREWREDFTGMSSCMVLECFDKAVKDCRIGR